MTFKTKDYKHCDHRGALAAAFKGLTHLFQVFVIHSALRNNRPIFQYSNNAAPGWDSALRY